MTKRKNPLIFLDVSIDGDPAERMIFELFQDAVPKIAENFRALCTGENGTGSTTGKPLHYKGSIFHRIIKGSLAQGGDFSKRNGTGGESIYGGKFSDENSRLKHDGPGLLSMTNTGRDSYGSQFFITFRANSHLDRKHVVFGNLVHGHETLKKIEEVGTEEGEPAALVKIVDCGELFEGKNAGAAMLENDKRKAFKSKSVKDASSDAHSHEIRHKRKHKKSSREKRRKKRRRYYTSESDFSSDTESDSSDYDSDSDSYSSSSSYVSSSSDDRRRKRKRSSKRDKYKRGKRRRDKRREKRRRRRDKRSRRKSKRTLGTPSDTESESTGESSSSEEDGADVRKAARKPKSASQISGGNQSPLTKEGELAPVQQLEEERADMLEEEMGECPRENGELRINGVEAEAKSDQSADGKPDVVDDHPSKSRSRSMSPKRTMSKSMSISPRRSLSKSLSVSPKRSVSRSQTPSVSGSPSQPPQRSRSISRSPARSDSSRSPARSVSRSPIKGKPGRSISRSPVRTQPRSVSRSSIRSITRRSMSRSPPRAPGQRTISRSRSPVKTGRRTVGRSPMKGELRRSISRSPGRGLSRRSISQSPVRPPSRNNRRSYSRSPVSPERRARSPYSTRGRSLSKSVSPDGSPKRIRRGRGFSQRYSYARRYRTPSPDRFAVRSHRYGGRGDRDRYSSYRGYSDRSPRRYRSPPRGRTPPRYRGRRSRTRSRSVSRSPVRYRSRRYTRSPARSRSPIERSRSRVSPRAEKPRSISRSRSPSESRSSLDSPSPKPASKDKSRTPSESPSGKKGLVSYGDGSPDSGQR